MGISDALDDELPQDSLGQKGASTRGRLMASARRLLAERSAVGLTSLAIAQGAGMSAASFYNYFVNVEAIIHALCVEAGTETRGIVEAARLRPGDDQQAIARRFVDAYDDHWRAFRPVLSVRNMEAERGNIAFQLLRRSFYHAMIDILLDAAQALRPATGDAEIEDRSGQIAVAVAAIERLAPAAGLYLDEPNSFRRFPRDLLRGAQVDLLADALGSEPKGG
jgi:AcrR family transcriptional regulator